jgi:protein SCO1/2
VRAAGALLAGLLLALACGAPRQDTYEVLGVVQAVAADEGQVKISHEDIPGFMPAMTMNFDVVPPSLLEGIEPGARVQFTLERDATTLRITRIEQIGREEGSAGQSGFGGLLEREPAPDFALVDQHGEQVTLAEFRGKAVLLDFIFTRCSGPCPILTSSHVTLQRRLSSKIAERTQFLSISLDPEHDTPAELLSYARARGANLDSWAFLTGEIETVRETVQSYHVGWTRDPDTTLNHLVVTFLIDPEGRIAKRYLGLEHGTDELVSDIEELVS